MEIRVHPASSLYPQQEILPSLLDGRSEIGPVLSGYLTDVLLELGVLELPFMTASLEEHRKAQQQLKPFFTEQLGKKGLKLLTAHAWPSQQVFSHQPIRTIADWKGKKIRVYGADSSNITRALGGVPGQHPVRRALHRAREEDGGRGHHLGHQRRADEVLRGLQDHQLLVPRRRLQRVARHQPEGLGRRCPRTSSRSCSTPSRRSASRTRSGRTPRPSRSGRSSASPRSA